MRGLNLELERQQQRGDEWKFGAAAVDIAQIPQALRDEYLPIGETQFGIEDTMDCASRGPINLLEAKFTYLYKTGALTADNRAWLENKGYIVDGRVVFSDAFVAINSGTTREGNSMKAPLEAIRKQGLIPKPMLPLLPTMTFDQYHDVSRITSDMRELGRAFALRFTINYEQVYEAQFADVLTADMATVALYAWPSPRNGEYPRTDGPHNHLCVLYRLPEYHAYDNYPDFDDARGVKIPGDYTKKLANNYDFFEYGYRIRIASQNDVQLRISLIERILALLTSLLGLLKRPQTSVPNQTTQTPSTAPTVTPDPPQPTPAPSKIHQWALAIEKQEGGRPTDLNMRLNNPGNIKWTDYSLGLAPGASKGPAASDKGFFLHFDTYEHGHEALCQFLRDACNDLLIPFHDARTILTFTRTYAHPPNDNYARAVAQALGVTVNTRIETLL